MTTHPGRSALPWAGALGVFVLAAGWPLRDALQNGGAAGAGPDVAATLWGMWWFSEEWTGPAWRGVSTLANFPSGTIGAVLAPVTSALWALFQAGFGPETATTLTDLATLAGWCGMVAWIARLSGVGRATAALAGVLALHGRYLVYATGEASVVGITALPALAMTGALLAWRAAPRRRWLVLYVCASAILGLEYPYLAPLPPLLGALAWAERRDRKLLLSVLLATGLVVVAAAMVGRGQVSFGSGRTADTVPLFGWHFPMAEAEPARAAWVDTLLPGPVVWSLGVADGTLAARGREYLGLTLVIAALGGAWVRPRKALPWLGAGLAGAALATGSSWGGYASPFALLNSVAAQAIRELTQPTRFLVLCSAALPVAAAHLIDHISMSRRGWAAAVSGLLLADALCFGGLSLRVPVIHLPEADCVARLAALPRTAVLTAPWDALSDGEALVHSRAWQVRHGQSGPAVGVGSWTWGEGKLGTSRLDALRVSSGMLGDEPLLTGELMATGYTHLVVDRSVGGWLETAVRGSLGPPQLECAGAAVFELAKARPAGQRPAVDVPPEWRRRAALRAVHRLDGRGIPIAQ